MSLTFGNADPTTRDLKTLDTLEKFIKQQLFVSFEDVYGRVTIRWVGEFYTVNIDGVLELIGYDGSLKTLENVMHKINEYLEEPIV